MNAYRLVSMGRIVFVFLMMGAAAGCATTVGPGRVAVLWRASNGTQSNTYGEGLHYIAPWNNLYVYDLRSMSHDEVLDVIAVNGLGIKLDASVRNRSKITLEGGWAKFWLLPSISAL
jgi:hypothetical protein